MTDAELDKITHENAMRWYRFDPFAHRRREQCTVGALRAEVAGHDVSVRAMDGGRRDPSTMSLGDLARSDCLMAITKPAGKREERRALHQEVSRTQILDAAEEVFAAKGYHEATIKEIAHLAEFSVGAVYSFFEHKDDLFVQIYLRRGAEFMDGMRDVMVDARPPLDQLHALADYQVNFFRTHPNFGRLYLHTSAVVLGDLETKLDTLVADRYAEAMQLQRDMFRAGQRDGSFPTETRRSCSAVQRDGGGVPEHRPRRGCNERRAVPRFPRGCVPRLRSASTLGGGHDLLGEKAGGGHGRDVPGVQAFDRWRLREPAGHLQLQLPRRRSVVFVHEVGDRNIHQRPVHRLEVHIDTVGNGPNGVGDERTLLIRQRPAAVRVPVGGGLGLRLPGVDGPARLTRRSASRLEALAMTGLHALDPVTTFGRDGSGVQHDHAHTGCGAPQPRRV